MRQHLLRVERPAAEFEELITAVQEEGLRAGWLELVEAAPEPLPPGLAAAAGSGVLKAVAAGGGRSVAVKPMRGAPVLRDLLREHFRGCTLVLVRGAVDAPLVESRDGGWKVVGPQGEHRLTSGQLAAALRQPRPW